MLNQYKSDEANIRWTKTSMADGYASMVQKRVKSGWTCDLLTLMFPQMKLPADLIVQRMKDEIERVYSLLVTRVHRNPSSAPIDKLPILIAAADLPVPKRQRISRRAVNLNSGFHFHAILLIPPHSRLKQSAKDHFGAYADMYTDRQRKIERIDVQPVIDDPAYVVQYALKTLAKGRVAYDDGILILPRLASELPAPIKIAA